MKKLTFCFLLIFALAAINGYSKNRQDKCFNKKQIKNMMTKAALWQLYNPKHKLYDWTNGAFYAEISAAYRTTGEKESLQTMIDMDSENQWNPEPRLQHADDITICQTYINVYRIKKNPSMIQPFKEQMDRFISTPQYQQALSK